MTDIAVTAEPVPQAPFSWKWFLFSVTGRITRKQYWLRMVLPSWLISVVLMLVDMGTGTFDEDSGFGLLSGVFTLVCLWPSCAVSAKRLHDRDKSGWWQLLIFIPIIGWIYLLIVIGFLRGTTGPNRFGPDPLAP